MRRVMPLVLLLGGAAVFARGEAPAGQQEVVAVEPHATQQVEAFASPGPQAVARVGDGATQEIGAAVPMSAGERRVRFVGKVAVAIAATATAAGSTVALLLLL